MTEHAVYRPRSFVVVVMVASVLWSVLEALAQTPDIKIASIEIRGAKRIEIPAIVGRLTLKVGDRYTPETVRGQVKILYDAGFFEDVQVETESIAEGMAVTFVVQEKPFITEIVFDGNEQLTEEKLKEKTTIKSQTFLDQQQVKESAETIRLAYQHDGYYNAQVVPVIEALDEERKRLTFHIVEGEKAKVKTVIFEGLRAATKTEMLNVMSTREWIPWYGLVTRFKLPSIASDAGVLKREELTNDVERIKEVLLNKGYFNVRVGQPSVELTEDKKWFIVSYHLTEGEPFTIGEVGFRGNTVYEDPELREGLRIKEGEIFQRAKIRDEITRITDLYGSKGYSFAEVMPNVNPNNEERTVNLFFNIKEGEMMRIRQINIYGNDKTRDNVIRREIRVDEQDVIDTASLKRSFQRLNNLNFFETVEILPAQVASDKVDLNVRVKEKPTGMFSLGGGFSTLDRLVAIADITQGNLGGYGYMGRIRGQLGQRRSLGSITFRNPYLYDSLTSLQVDGYRSITNYLSYYEQRTGGNVTLGRWLSEYVTGSISLFGEQITFSDPQTGICTPGNELVPIVCRQLGTRSSTGFRTSMFRDTRDYYLDPRSGWRIGGGFDIGTPYMGGTNNFIKYYADVIKVTPLPFDMRLSLRTRFGEVHALGGTQIPLNERFFVGGINTMRGFSFGRAGPTVPTTHAPYGAAKQLIFNAELIFTVSAEAKLNGVLFFDYGKGFDDNEPLSLNLRPAAGIEGRWISPFGPLRVAYGINLDRRTGERMGVFEFTIGTLF
ncbi:MAG: putative Outer membrane protein assembly factor YaeT [Nitrospira sp.]